MTVSLPAPVAVRFLLDAEPSAGLLPRLLQPFARRDLVPDAIRADRDGATMRVEIAMTAISAADAHLVRGNLVQIVGVRRIQAV